MQTQNQLPRRGTLVQIVHAQAAPFTIIYIQVVGRERVAFQVGKAIIWRSDKVHGGSSL
jgi:hypothetical protein